MRANGAYLTGAEAEQLECPHFRDMINQGDVQNYSVHPIYVHRQCQVTACIAWRWQGGSEKAAIAASPDGALRGYCGIAGRPD